MSLLFVHVEIMFFGNYFTHLYFFKSFITDVPYSVDKLSISVGIIKIGAEINSQEGLQARALAI